MEIIKSFFFILNSFFSTVISPLYIRPLIINPQKEALRISMSPGLITEILGCTSKFCEVTGLRNQGHYAKNEQPKAR